MSNLDTIIVQRPDEVVLIDNDTFLISHGEQGPRGVSGISAYQQAVLGGFVGTEAEWLASLKQSFLSADPDNRTREGSDGGLYTPELEVDPLAYYILAKS